MAASKLGLFFKLYFHKSPPFSPPPAPWGPTVEIVFLFYFIYCKRLPPWATKPQGELVAFLYFPDLDMNPRKTDGLAPRQLGNQPSRHPWRTLARERSAPSAGVQKSIDSWIKIMELSFHPPSWEILPRRHLVNLLNISRKPRDSCLFSTTPWDKLENG